MAGDFYSKKDEERENLGEMGQANFKFSVFEHPFKGVLAQKQCKFQVYLVLCS